MFTGIITDVGTVVAVDRRGDTLFTIATAFDMDTVDIGASIACSGCCLTVIEKEPAVHDLALGRDAVQDDARRLGEGTEINLERALAHGRRTGRPHRFRPCRWRRRRRRRHAGRRQLALRVEVPARLARFIAPKGSIALDGVSLTVNEVEGRRFGVNIIPHTARSQLRHAKAGRPGQHREWTCWPVTSRVWRSI